jgi:hypothetical protein
MWNHRRKIVRRIQAFLRRSSSIIRLTGPFPPGERNDESRRPAATIVSDDVESMSTATATSNQRFSIAVNSTKTLDVEQDGSDEPRPASQNLGQPARKLGAGRARRRSSAIPADPIGYERQNRRARNKGNQLPDWHGPPFANE